jgi:ABC-2 type transport system ATP-binding protein
MMKKGRLIALENKDTLLSRSAAREVSLQLSGPLPASLQPLSLRQQDGRHILALPDIAKLEQVLSELRLAAVEVRELSVHETDLEQVFVKLMHGGQL